MDVLLHLIVPQSELGQDPGCSSLLLTQQAEKKMLGRDVELTPAHCLVAGELQATLRVWRERYRTLLHRSRQPLERFADRLLHFVAADVAAHDGLHSDAVRLHEDAVEHVLGADKVVRALFGFTACGQQDLLGFLGELDCHGELLLQEEILLVLAVTA